SLNINVSVTNISGTGFGGLPTFGNREINTVIRLKDGETNMLAGLIRDEERTVVDGIPGLSDIPGVGHLFAHNTKTIDQTDIILTLTPRMLLNCSSAKSRSSYIQSWTSVCPSHCVASTVTRLTMSLGNPGHSPVVMRPAACGRDSRTEKTSPAIVQAIFIRLRTAATTSMSSARAPR